jgi:hypothetical protein
MKKVMAPIQNHCIPSACMLVETSSVESHELSPDDLLLKAASRPASNASLQLAPAAGTSEGFRFSCRCYYLRGLVNYILHVALLLCSETLNFDVA